MLERRITSMPRRRNHKPGYTRSKSGCLSTQSVPIKEKPNLRVRIIQPAAKKESSAMNTTQYVPAVTDSSSPANGSILLDLQAIRIVHMMQRILVYRRT
jgi:hypothetical protein